MGIGYYERLTEHNVFNAAQSEMVLHCAGGWEWIWRFFFSKHLKEVEKRTKALRRSCFVAPFFNLKRRSVRPQPWLQSIIPHIQLPFLSTGEKDYAFWVFLCVSSSGFTWWMWHVLCLPPPIEFKSSLFSEGAKESPTPQAWIDTKSFKVRT